ncbi:MAG: DUF2017 family protein [Acidimicrobiales bacterium]
MVSLSRFSFKVKRDGSVTVSLDDDERNLLRAVFGELRDLLLVDDDDGLRRLYPTAYPNDAERDAGFQALVHGELLEKRLAALDEVEATVDAEVLTVEQLHMWMTTINEIRLVLGTKLDVSENDTSFDPDAPNAQAVAVYMHLGYLLEQIVSALTATL